MDPHRLTHDALIKELQQCSESLKHTCLTQPSQLSSALIKSAVPRALQNLTSSKAVLRKGEAAYQLFLTTISGFGIKRDIARAFKFLEDAAMSGSHYCCVWLCRHSLFINRDLSPQIPFRKWLAITVLFAAGIPSEAYLALVELDPILARIVAVARSKVYNGSTASFVNTKFNAVCDLYETTSDLSMQFSPMADGSSARQDKSFENTLLHLTAGSENSNTSVLEYCTSVLKIDKNVRNTDGVTPLLMACRAGREEKILALLHLDVDVDLVYAGGETPLH